jgi:hypothetical protein
MAVSDLQLRSLACNQREAQGWRTLHDAAPKPRSIGIDGDREPSNEIDDLAGFQVDPAPGELSVRVDSWNPTTNRYQVRNEPSREKTIEWMIVSNVDVSHRPSA